MKMFRLALLVLLTSTALSVAASAHGDEPPLETVPYVDLQRYLGKWYEIASFPQSFQKGCVGTQATYSLRDDGDIEVLNQCYDGSFEGKVRTARGKAWVTDRATNAKLRVQFFWPFSGKYWVLELGENYEYAVIGHPNRDYLWILSRTPQLDRQVLNGIIERVKAKGFDINRLKETLQKSEPLAAAAS